MVVWTICEIWQQMYLIGISFSLCLLPMLLKGRLANRQRAYNQPLMVCSETHIQAANPILDVLISFTVLDFFSLWSWLLVSVMTLGPNSPNSGDETRYLEWEWELPSGPALGVHAKVLVPLQPEEVLWLQLRSASGTTMSESMTAKVAGSL